MSDIVRDPYGNPLNRDKIITALRAEVERLRGEATGIALEAQKVCLQNIQMKFALGYPMDANLEKYVLPKNPFKCGTCAASRTENEKLRAALEEVRALVLSANHSETQIPIGPRRTGGEAMTDITIPREAEEEAAKAAYNKWRDKIRLEERDTLDADMLDEFAPEWDDLGENQQDWIEQARAACLAMLKAWPETSVEKTHIGISGNVFSQDIILPLTETADEP